MSERLNDINESMELSPDNINESMKGNRCGKVKQTEHIARTLVDIFVAPKSYNFFLKTAWNLPEFFIRNAVESSRRPKIKSPVKYFVAICSNEMQKLQQQK